MRLRKLLLCAALSMLVAGQALADTPAAGHSAGQVRRDAATGMDFVWVPGGCFHMGDTFGKRDSDEKPVHEVCLDGFWLGRTPVTQAQWGQVMETKANRPAKGPDYPADAVTWRDAKTYVTRLNAKAKDGGRFRLPTEAEWEYACRSGGKAEMFAGGGELANLGWYSANSDGEPHPVAQKAPNGLGLYDMSGLVFQWTEDVYEKDAYRHHARNNPLHTGGWGRVARGGWWGGGADCARCSFRCYLSDRCGNASTGLRLVLTPK